MDKREMCKYGKDCYQINPFHLAKFRHPSLRSSPDISMSPKRLKLDNSSASSKRDDGASKSYDISDSSGDEEKTTGELSSFTESVTERDTGEGNNENLIVIRNLSGSDKDKLKQLYSLEFPDDFFSFFRFCASVDSKSPKTALKDIGLELVGAFDLLSGDMVRCSGDDIIRHYRYYYDPPEFYTVLRSTGSQFHYGYFFDEPDGLPVFVASNDPEKGCIVNTVAETIFGAVDSHISSLIKISDPFIKTKIVKIRNSLTKWAKENDFNLETNSLSLRKRNSKVVTKTLHTAGLVVPYDSKMDVGYRPLSEDAKTLQQFFDKIKECDNENERRIKWEKIQHVITYSSIAADECDFGTPLELGIAMFCQGHECFHRTAQQFMSMAYNLLSRNRFSDVITVHLKHRIKGSELNFAARQK